LLALLRVLGGLNQVLGLIPLTQVSPLDSVDLGHERKKARRFGKRETSAKASK